ncbi:MAG: uracil-DNA glycosylase [Bacteroidales bacterium]|nr:uracil-DNA glycosylase [Bacteroidales bacterium]MBD5281935.1 uracil-DNA glycosylase [Bacteroides sp.]MBD5352593.1 uracil-DNA glycosylase [Bacteroides sp.]
MVRIESSWAERLEGVFASAEWERLAEFVRREYANELIFPPAGKIFAALDSCPFDRVKVVIIGQDPYHGVGQANGLAFSVAPGVAIPPSLQNIFKEVSADMGVPMPVDGDLTRWAEQGVLLLNSSLTVKAGKPASHAGMGWEVMTDAAIKALSDGRENLVFLLWGAHAGKKSGLIDPSKHLILKAPHPSPLSAHRGFFGCRHFSRANAYLQVHNISPIVW